MTIIPAGFQISKLHRNSLHTIINHKSLKWSVDPTIKPQLFSYILPNYEPCIIYDHLMMLSGTGTATVIKNHHMHLDRNPTDAQIKYTLSTKNSLGCFLHHHTTPPCTLSSDVNVWSLRAFLSIRRYENRIEIRPGCMQNF
jgi:hypothetical protein